MNEKDKQGVLNPNGSQTEEDILLDDFNIVASSMECTGLMPRPPASEEEEESYADIYPVPQVASPVDNGLQKEKGVNSKK